MWIGGSQMSVTALYAMALPPELHRLQLESGVGPSPMLAAAGAYTALSAEHAAAATELTALLAQVQADTWQGPSAGRYQAAHLPYVAWLEKTSADCAQTAVAYESAVAAYELTLATTPTSAELIANRTLRGVLIATNFFGINTIPIAVNEAWYAAQWIRTALAMIAYGAACDAAVLSAPPNTPAPMLLAPGAGEAAAAVGGAEAAAVGTLGGILTVLLTALFNIVWRIIEAIIGIVIAAFSLSLSGIILAIQVALFAIYVEVFIAFFSFIGFIIANPWLVPAGLLALFALPPALAPEVATAIAVPVSVPLGVDRVVHDARLAEDAKKASDGEPARRSVASSLVREVHALSPAAVEVSDRGAESMGFSGTAGQETLPRPGGLITLAGDQCDGDPRVPMLPATWAPHPV